MIQDVKFRSSAREQFFATVELAALMLSLLQPHDLLAASQVDKNFHAIIKGSADLRQVLSNGPTKHYSDKPPEAWTTSNITFHDDRFGHNDLLLGYVQRARVYRLKASHSRQSIETVRREPYQPVQLCIDWNSPTEDFDSLRDQYVTNPPIPTILRCFNVFVLPSHCDITMQNCFDETLCFFSARVTLRLGICTFGEAVRVAKILERNPPKQWDVTDVITGTWRPHEEYPELSSDPEFRTAIASINAWPVIWEPDVRRASTPRCCEINYDYSSPLMKRDMNVASNESVLQGKLIQARLLSRIDQDTWSAQICEYDNIVNVQIQSPLELEALKVDQEIHLMPHSTDGNNDTPGTGRSTALAFKAHDVKRTRYRRIGAVFDFPSDLLLEFPLQIVSKVEGR